MTDHRVTSSNEERLLGEERESELEIGDEEMEAMFGPLSDEIDLDSCVGRVSTSRVDEPMADAEEFEALWMFAEIEARERVGFDYDDVLEDAVRDAARKEK